MNQTYDVIIIGGGATGAGIARDCSLRGIKALLIERSDISTGATGRNHGLLHSGARYAVTDHESAVECIRENMILRRIAAHCVEETDGLFITLPEDGLDYQARFVEACRKAGIRADVLDPEEARRLEPAANPSLIGAVRVPDGAVDPFRLTSSNILAATAHGAEIRTYTEVRELIREQDRIVGVKAYDYRTHAELEFRAQVVVNAGGGVDFTPIVDKARAVLMAWYPGQEGGRAIAEILTGRINPSGRLPITVERRAEDNPTFDSYRANVAQVYNSPLRVSYDEGVFVGYRGYDRAGTEPMYPFGYGLSYTTFDYANLKMERLDDGNVVVSFEVTNTGRFAGSEVAQLYVGDEVASVPRPEKELKGYEKVRLEPGETKSVEIRLSPDAFAFYDMNRHDFVVEPGDFTISVGASSRDIR